MIKKYAGHYLNISKDGQSNKIQALFSQIISTLTPNQKNFKYGRYGL